ncbi:hypothetical protein [Amycolatopsis sp. GM8]|uniref:hypothetical protein n=1 Tax=Amycolatopsis sp. GM8 TaxID=2896530 RepID=UPI001F25EB0A|nr:hypothetical protein [Amycolatopsis sp. GM8]
MYGQTLLLAMTAYGVASCPQGLLGFSAMRSASRWVSATGRCSSGSPSATPATPPP